MAVDPTFFGRGLGSALCRHGVDMARSDGLAVGVIAAGMGEKLYTSLGFKTIEKKTIKDERLGREAEVEFWVQTCQ